MRAREWAGSEAGAHKLGGVHWTPGRTGRCDTRAATAVSRSGHRWEDVQALKGTRPCPLHPAPSPCLGPWICRGGWGGGGGRPRATRALPPSPRRRLRPVAMYSKGREPGAGGWGRTTSLVSEARVLNRTHFHFLAGASASARPPSLPVSSRPELRPSTRHAPYARLSKVSDILETPRWRLEAVCVEPEQPSPQWNRRSWGLRSGCAEPRVFVATAVAPSTPRLNSVYCQRASERPPSPGGRGGGGGDRES